MKQVLIAEDNQADREMLRMMFRKVAPQIEPSFVVDGEELLAHLETANIFDLCFLLLDLNMPRVSGTDVLRKLNQDVRYSTLPVIVLSSSIHVDDVHACYAEGANAYVRKFESAEEGERAIRAIAEFWGGVNVLAKPEVVEF